MSCDNCCKKSNKSVKDYIITIPDFPKEGIMFRDVTGILQDAEGFQLAVDEMAKLVDPSEVDAFAGAEARGFVFASVLSYLFHKPLVLIRKKGKLPRETVSASYALEYGTAEIEVNKDAICPGQKIVIVDDLLATGGTGKACAEVVEKLGGKVSKIIYLLELAGLNGRELLSGYDVGSVVSYEGK